MTYPDPNSPYKLYTAASDTTIGAVLAQDTPEGEKVIQYISHKLNPGQQKWPVIEREAYAIIYSINKLMHYLYGAHFTVYCDHKPRQNLFTSEMKNTRVQRWAIQLEEYSPYMEYKPGKKNEVADLMSRIDTETDDDHYTPVVNIIDLDYLDKTLEQHKQREDTIREVDISEVQKSIMQSLDILKLQKADSYCQQLFKSIQNETSEQNMQNFVIMDDLVYHVSAPLRLDPEPHLQVVIPSCLTPTILKMYHDELGHLCIDNYYDKIRSRYFWSNMYHDVVLHINRCDLCTSRKAKRQRAPLGDTPVPKYPFEIIGIDTCGPYIESEGGTKYVIVVIDHFSGWPEAYTISDKSTLTVAGLLLEDFIPRHSCPRLIISDQGTEFNNTLVDSLSAELNIHCIRTSPYHPQSNGKTERFNRVMNGIISKYVSPGQRDWDASTAPASSVNGVARRPSNWSTAVNTTPEARLLQCLGYEDITN